MKSEPKRIKLTEAPSCSDKEPRKIKLDSVVPIEDYIDNIKLQNENNSKNNS